MSVATIKKRSGCGIIWFEFKTTETVSKENLFPEPVVAI